MKILWVIIKKIIKISLILIILFFILFTTLWFFPINNQLSKGVNQKAIASLKLGMSKKEVLSILGEPLFKEKTTTKGIKKGFNINIFNYGESGFIAGTDMNVVFEDNHMTSVYIGFMGASFYYCSERNCRGIGEPFHYDWFIPKE